MGSLGADLSSCADLASSELSGRGVQVLNRGGFANPDVLVVPLSNGWEEGERVVVKDYGRCSALVRALLAPALIRRELAILGRVAGLPGVPGPRGRVGRLAFALDYLEGEALQRRRHGARIPPVFFDALEGILAGLADRGVAYLDLRSSTNVLVTPTGGPALVDFGSATRFPLPRALRWLIERRALDKLRARFESHAPAPEPAEAEDDPVCDLRAGRVRIRYRERGPGEDPVPLLLLPEVGVGCAAFAPVLEAAAKIGRRAIAIDLPGSGGSGRPRFGFSARRLARDVEALIDVLRLTRVDLVGWGVGGLVARCTAVQAPHRVRSITTLETPLRRIGGDFQRRYEAARKGAGALRAALRDAFDTLPPSVDKPLLAAELGVSRDRSLLGAYRTLRVEADPLGARVELVDMPMPRQPWLLVGSHPAEPVRAPVGGVGRTARVECWDRPLADPARLVRAVAALVETRITDEAADEGPGEGDAREPRLESAG